MKLDIQLNRPQRGHQVIGAATLCLDDTLEVSGVRSKLSAFATVRVKERGQCRKMVNRLLDQIPIDIEPPAGLLEAGRHDLPLRFPLPFILYPSKLVSVKGDSRELVFSIKYVLSVAVFAKAKGPGHLSEQWSDDDAAEEGKAGLGFVQCAGKARVEVPQSLDAPNSDSISPGFNSVTWQEESGCCFQADGPVIMSLRTPGIKANSPPTMHADLHIDNQGSGAIKGLVQIRRKAILVTSSEDDPVVAEQVLCRKSWGPVGGHSILSRSIDLPFSVESSVQYAGEKSPRLMRVQNEGGDTADDFGTFTFTTEDHLEVVCQEGRATCKIKLVNNGKN